MDSAVDKLLEANGSDEAKALEGKAAVANARLAYELFEKKFAEDPRWADLAARAPRFSVRLWASTGTKNAAYSDCKYVDELVAKHIVNTTEKTLNALADPATALRPSRAPTKSPTPSSTSWLSSASTSRGVTDKLGGRRCRRLHQVLGIPVLADGPVRHRPRERLRFPSTDACLAH